MSAFATRFCGTGKSYDPLLQYLISLGREKAEDAFQLNTIARVTGWNSSKVRKEIEKLYCELTEQIQENETPITFSKPEVTLYLKAQGKYQCMTVSLDVIPRIGENLYVPYFKAKLKHCDFFVERIDHDFIETRHLISIRLMVGYANQHKQYKKDQVYAEGHMSMDEYFNLNSYDMQELIRSRKI